MRMFPQKRIKGDNLVFLFWGSEHCMYCINSLSQGRPSSQYYHTIALVVFLPTPKSHGTFRTPWALGTCKIDEDCKSTRGFMSFIVSPHSNLSL